MLKQTLWAIVSVFLSWSVLDFLIHEILLKSTYQATADIWRPVDQMNMPLMTFVTLVFSICFVAIYRYLIHPKSLTIGIKYGSILGLAMGVSMGFGSYGYLPIPLNLAISWCVASLVELTIAGALVGLLVKEHD